MCSNQILCLVENADLYPKLESIDIYSIYASQRKLFRGIRYLHHKTNILKYFKRVWLDKWKCEVEKYKTIIIFDSILDYYPLEYIRHFNKNCNLIFCYRNRVSDTFKHGIIVKDPHYIKSKYNSMVCSYSKEDCIKYTMKYYSQFHIIPKEYINCNYPIVRDVYFIGQDKGRHKILDRVINIFKDKGISYLFEIVSNDKTEIFSDDYNILKSAKSYRDILEMCSRSKCILEIVGNNNKGVTYRTLEAIALKRKLITNHKELKNSEFYDSDNMFIIGIDEEDKLLDFVHSSYIYNNIDSDKFSFDSFCKSIVNNYSPHPLL